MNKLKAYTFTIILSTLTFTQKSYAVVAPPITEQVKQAAEWFTGSFDNAEQVAGNSTVPVITMSNCPVQLDGTNQNGLTENIYLEQKSTAFERVRFYSFSPVDSAVKLSIYSFVNNNPLNGICNRPESSRIVSTNNLVSTSCDLNLKLELDRYIGNDAPNGCPTSTGGKVVSQVAIAQNTIDSLDQIFSANGTLLVNTPIAFKRLKSIPEPDYNLGLLSFSIWGINSVRRGHKRHED